MFILILGFQLKNEVENEGKKCYKFIVGRRWVNLGFLNELFYKTVDL